MLPDVLRFIDNFKLIRNQVWLWNTKNLIIGGIFDIIMVFEHF